MENHCVHNYSITFFQNVILCLFSSEMEGDIGSYLTNCGRVNGLSENREILSCHFRFYIL